MSIRLVIVADGGPALGLGHLSRCLALAHYMQGLYPLVWLTSTPNAWLQAQLAPLGVSLTEISAQQLHRAILPGDLVVFDGYHLSGWHQRAVLDAGGRLVMIDDLAREPLVADVVVNTAPALTEQLYHALVAPYTRVLTGSDYALLRAPFAVAERAETVERRGIVLCLGGADSPNHSGQLAQALRALGQPISLIQGAANPHTAALEALSVQSEKDEGPHIVLRRDLSAETLYEALRSCSVAVTSASSMAQEAAAARAPLVVVQTAENQAHLYRGLLGTGCARGVASAAETDLVVEHARELLSSAKARASQLEAQRATYPGTYAHQWHACLRELAQGLWLRRADGDDAQRLLDWANDPLTRANSYRQDLITWAEHTAWLDRSIADPNTTLWIVMRGEEPLGQIRLVREPAAARSTLSVGLAPAARGRGLAAPALSRAVAAYGARHPGEPIHALIKQGNTASVRAFRQAGFLFQADTLIENQASHHCIFVP